MMYAGNTFNVRLRWKADVQNKMKLMEVGGVDYITKPVQFEELLARINKHLTIQE